MLYYIFITVIEVEFTEPLFFGNEATGMIEARIRASGFSQQPYDVIVMPVEADPPDALGLLIYTFLLDLQFCFDVA